MARFGDDFCDYSTIFSHREDGQIPCLAIRKDTVYDFDDHIGEINGICFQKVDAGCVKPVLDNSLFLKVQWPNAPTRIQQRNWQADFHLTSQVFVPTESWAKFGNLMFHLRRALITQMTSPNSQPPESLLDGLRSNYWLRGTDDNRKKTPIETQMQSLKQMLGEHWVGEKVYVQWVQCLVEGLVGGRPKVGNLLDHLLKVYDTAGKEIEEAPKSTTNKSIRNGVVHCLTYGYTREQLDISKEEAECDVNLLDHDRQRHKSYTQERSRLRQRILLPKRTRSTSRSRSRSPSPTNNITQRIINIRNHRNTSLQDMLQSPEDFEVHPNWLHSYFESHTPHFLIYSSRLNNLAVKAEILVQICAYNRYSSNLKFSTYLEYCTEQAVQQCLASLSPDQTEVLGLVMVPDGLKLIKVVKVLDQNRTVSYKVQETDLVQWDETQNLYLLLKEMEKVIQQS